MRTFIKGLALAAALLSTAGLCAQDKAANTTDHQNPWKHQVSIGIGDPLTETVFYRATPHKDYTDLRQEAKYLEQQNYHYLPHIFADYYYSFKDWLHVGCQVDFGCFYWNNVYYKGGSNQSVSSEKQINCNICVLPEVRFDWFRRTHFRLFSTVRLGIDINTGSEKDYLGRNTAVGIAIDPTFIGCSYGWEHWFAAFELGSLSALCGTAQIFMVQSKTFALSGGYRF